MNTKDCLIKHNVGRIVTALVAYSLTTAAISAPVGNNALTNLPLQSSPNAVIVNDVKQLPTPELHSPKSDDNFTLPPIPKSSPTTTAQGEGTAIVKSVTFTGNTVISNEELQKIAQPFLNHPLTARDIEQLRNLITFAYVDAGYINSGAIIPPQAANSNDLHITLIEGQLTTVRLEGMERLRKDYVADRLKLGAGSPLNFKDLQQKYQSLLNDPLIERLNGSLLPGAHLGESVLTVKVTRARPYQLYADADNYTTPVIGGYTGHIGGWVDNLSGFGERIDADFMATGGALGVNTGIDIPLNAYDTHATFRYTNTHASLIENNIKTAGIKADIIGYEGGLSQPVYQQAGIDVKVGGTLSVRESRTTALGSPITFVEGLPNNQGTTQVTALRLWQQYSHQGENNAFVARSTFTKGLNALGSTIQHNNLLPSSEFFSWLGQAQYTHRVMDNGANIVLRGAVQQSANPLLPLERFSVGGVYSVRGYRENYYVKDNGFNTGADFRYPLFGGDAGAEHSLFVIPFIDVGGAWNNPTLADLQPKKDYLCAMGLGFNWHYKKINTEFFWAHDLVGATAAGRNIQDSGVHFKVSLVAF